MFDVGSSSDSDDMPSFTVARATPAPEEPADRDHGKSVDCAVSAGVGTAGFGAASEDGGNVGPVQDTSSDDDDRSLHVDSATPVAASNRPPSVDQDADKSHAEALGGDHRNADSQATATRATLFEAALDTDSDSEGDGVAPYVAIAAAAAPHADVDGDGMSEASSDSSHHGAVEQPRAVESAVVPPPPSQATSPSPHRAASPTAASEASSAGPFARGADTDDSDADDEMLAHLSALRGNDPDRRAVAVAALRRATHSDTHTSRDRSVHNASASSADSWGDFDANDVLGLDSD